MSTTGHWGAVLGAALLIAGTLGGVPVTAGSIDTGPAGATTADDENEAPLADAGLDQEVSVNATVYLDASGSRDPDGHIDSYEWSIERPDGHHIEPACEDCARTEFRVTMNGTYEVTVTVTDDDGATSSDTLYVQASEIEGPSVELSGPTAVSPGANTTYTATATAGESPLMDVEWERNGTELADRGIGGESATDDITVGLEAGTYRLTVQVTSELGRTDTATLIVNASTRPVPPCEGATWNETTGLWDVDPCEGSDGDEESCYDAQTERAREWERQHPDKEFACYNDVWFGGESPSIMDSNENDRFEARGVSVGWSTAQNWAAHPNVSIKTSSGYKKLKFHNLQVWKNAKLRRSPFNNGDDDNENGNGDDDGDDNDDGDDDNGDDDDDKIPCRKLPKNIQDILDRCD